MDVLAVVVLVMLAALLLLVSSARKAITLFEATVQGGELKVTRHRLAPGVVAAIAEIVRRPPVPRATLRIVRNRDHARLDARGALTPEQLQRLRNAIGTVPLARLLGPAKR